MIILGMEASAKVAGAALYKDGQIVTEQMRNGTLTHSETLMPMIEAVIQDAELQPEDLDAIAVTNGPGSFTGLRIGAATAKGLALALRIPIVPVPTLYALAMNLWGTDDLIVPMMDARRHQVYASIYDPRQDDQGEPSRILPEDTYAPSVLIEIIRKAGRRAVLVGDGAVVYYGMMKDALGEMVRLAPAHLLHARAATLCAIGADRLAGGLANALAEGKAVSGSELEIHYLRKPQAEREREARLAEQQSGGQGAAE